MSRHVSLFLVCSHCSVVCGRCDPSVLVRIPVFLFSSFISMVQWSRDPCPQHLLEGSKVPSMLSFRSVRNNLWSLLSFFTGLEKGGHKGRPRKTTGSGYPSVDRPLRISVGGPRIVPRFVPFFTQTGNPDTSFVSLVLCPVRDSLFPQRILRLCLSFSDNPVLPDSLN